VKVGQQSRDDKTHIYDSIIILDIAENLESPEFPLSAFRGVYRGNFKAPMYRRCLIVYELDRSLYFKLVEDPKTILARHKTRTATV